MVGSAVGSGSTSIVCVALLACANRSADRPALSESAAAPAEPPETSSDTPASGADAGQPPSAASVSATQDASASAEPPPPLLSGLRIEGGDGSLQPTFEPERLRYSVRATEPAGSLAITASAVDGLELLVDGRRVVSGERAAVAGAAPQSEVSVEVRNLRGASRTYTIVYLPAHFPRLVVSVHDPSASPDPLYVNLTQLGAAYFVAKLDNAGVPLFYREVDNRVFDFKQHPTGDLSYSLMLQDAAAGAIVVVMDQGFSITDQRHTVGIQHTDFHEFHLLEDGHAIMMAYEPTRRDMTAYGGEAQQRVDDSILQEIGPDGELLFEWNSWEYLPWDESVHYNDFDYAHVNSITVAPDGDWIVSARGLSQVIKLDRTTGAVLWRLGGIASDFTFVDDPLNGFCGQHTATELANGNILLFDNGTICIPENAARGERSRVAEYALDHATRKASLAWSYERPNVFATSQGSAQRLPNGNTLISWGFAAPWLATEVDRDGNLVFELEAQAEGEPFITYRAQRFPARP